MSVTIDIPAEKLRQAENALNIHDPTQLFLTLLEEKLARHEESQNLAAPGRDPSTPGKRTPRLFDFDRTLAAAAALPELSDGEFEAFERDLNRPLPSAWTECA